MDPDLQNPSLDEMAAACSNERNVANREIDQQNLEEFAPLRVLFVIDDSDYGETTRYLPGLLRRLLRMRTQLAVCSIDNLGDAVEKIQKTDVSVVSLEAPSGRGWTRSLASLMAMKSLIDKFRPNIVHVIGRRAALYAIPAAVAADLPLVQTLDTARNRGFAALFEGVMGRIAGPTLVCNDQDALADAPGLRRALRNEARVLGAAIDVGALRGTAVLNLEELPLQNPTIGVCPQAGKFEDLLVALEAFKYLQGAYADARLVIIAEAKQFPIAEWLEDQGIAAHVLFVPGPKNRDQAAVMRRCDIIWCPSISHPNQTTMLKAMALGIPLVCDHKTCLAPDITEFGGALMRDSAWPQQFAEASCEILADDELKKRLGESAKKLVTERHHIKTHSVALRRLYRDLARTPME